MATVNEDGSPHNTPYFFVYDHGLEHLYWASTEDAVHSRNILRTGKLFVVLFDAAGKGGGLYIEAANGHVLTGTELDQGMPYLNRAIARVGLKPLTAAFYQDNKPKLWTARTVRFWVNGADVDKDGYVLRDYRVEIHRRDLFEG